MSIHYTFIHDFSLYKLVSHAKKKKLLLTIPIQDYEDGGGEEGEGEGGGGQVPHE